MPRRPLSLLLALALATTTLAAFSGCTPAPAPVATDAHDPSNPSAPEGAATIASPPAPADGRAAHAGHGVGAHEHGPRDHAGHTPPLGTTGAAGTDAGVGLGSSRTDGGVETLYACPMHPEVMSRSEGLCPICNMKLVPKR